MGSIYFSVKILFRTESYKYFDLNYRDWIFVGFTDGYPLTYAYIIQLSYLTINRYLRYFMTIGVVVLT